MPDNELNEAKALNKIPNWAQHPEYECTKIIRAFFMVADAHYTASVDNIKLRCSDRTGAPDTYVRKFDGNWASLKTDTGHQNGKVFEQDANGHVTIWAPVREMLLVHRAEFMRTPTVP